MPVLDSICYLGLSQDERREQLYLALGGVDDSCFLGLFYVEQFRAMLELIGSDACIFTPEDFWREWLLFLDPDACTGLPIYETQAAVYALLYAEAGDDTLTPPECFLGLGPDGGMLALIAAAGEPIPSNERIVFASSVTPVDSDRETGGGTDGTTTLQTVLDTGDQEDSPLVLILDGPVLTTGLIVHAYTSIRGALGGGLYLADSSDRPVIQNDKRLTRAGDYDANIQIKDFWINGNGTNQTLIETGLEAYGTFVVGMWFGHCEALEVSNMEVKDAKTFTLLINDFIGGATATGIQVEKSAPATYDDPIHIWGPGVGVLALSCSGNPGDDMIGICIDELRTVGRPLQPYESIGDLMDPVNIVSVVGDSANQGVRLLSILSRLEEVNITSITGVFALQALTISYGIDGGGGFGNFGSVTVGEIQHSVSLLPPNWHGDAPFSNTGPSPRWNVVAVNGVIDELNLQDATLTNRDARPVVFFGDETNISGITIDHSFSNETNYQFGQYLAEGRLIDNLTVDGTGVYAGSRGTSFATSKYHGGDFTVTGWASTVANVSLLQTICGEWGYTLTGGLAPELAWVFFLNDGKLNFLANAGVVSSATGVGTFPSDGVERFYALRVNETANTAEIRVGGGAWVSVSLGLGITSSRSTLSVGISYGDVTGVGASQMNGSLRDVQVFPSALSDAAVNAIFALG